LRGNREKKGCPETNKKNSKRNKYLDMTPPNKEKGGKKLERRTLRDFHHRGQGGFYGSEERGKGKRRKLQN